MSRWDAEALRRQARRRRVTRKARRWHDFVLRMDKVGGQVDAVNEQTAEAIQSLERLQQMRISTRIGRMADDLPRWIDPEETP